MKRRRAKKNQPPSDEALLLASIASNTDKIAAKVMLRLNAAEVEREQYRRELDFLRGKLAAMLTEDQLEAARVCGVTPELYALELIDLWRFRTFPAFTPAIDHFGALTGRQPR